MQMRFERPYGVATTLNFTLAELDGVDFRTDPVHAAGDSKIMKDEGAEGNTANAFVDRGQGHSLALSASEMRAARIVIYLVDQTAPKAWMDTSLIVETYGHPNAQQPGLGMGTAQSGTASTIVLAATESFADNVLNGNVLKIVKGTGAGQARIIISNTLADDTCNVAPNWTTNPDATSVYEIVEGAVNVEALNGVASAAAKLAKSADKIVNGTVDDASFSPTTTEFECADITEALADRMIGRPLTLDNKDSSIISDYALTGGKGHFTVSPALAAAPANGDELSIT